MGRLNVLPVDLNDIRLNADDKKGPDVIRVNFRELLEAEIKTATEWLYEEQSRMLACSCKSGILLVRFAEKIGKIVFPLLRFVGFEQMEPKLFGIAFIAIANHRCSLPSSILVK